MGQRILALELSGDRVRAAMADRTFKALEFVGVYEQERAGDEADLSGAIARIVAAAGKPDIVISGLPGEFVAKRLLTLPFTDRRRLQQVVPFALEEHLPFPVDDAAVAFARVGREGADTLVIAALARKDDLRAHLELLARGGLEPKIVTLGTLALAGLLARARNGRGGAHLVVDIDHACTSMVLIDVGGTPRAMRTVGQGLNVHNGATIPQPAAAAILGAVRQTLLAHNSGSDTPDLVLAGAAAATPSVRNQIALALEVPVHDLADFDCSPLILGIKSEPMRFSGCIAMLLGEAPARPLELLNFRQGEFTFRGSGGAVSPLRVSAMLATAAAAFALLHVALGISISARKLNLLNRAVETVTAPALGATNPATAKTTLKAHIAQMNKQLRLMGGNLGHGSPLDLLLAVSRAIPPGITVQFDTVLIDDNGVKLEGKADSFATVDLVKKVLGRSGRFGAIQIDHAAAGSDPGKVEFKLSATLVEDAGGI
jgi:hypothetical protein